MATRSKEFIVDDLRYETTQFTAMKALRLLTKLAKIVGEPVGMMVSSGMDTEVDGSLIGKAIASLVQKLDENEVIDLVKQLFETTVFIDEGSRNPIMLDTHFAGRLGHMFKVLREILTFQYSDFFGELAGVSEVLRPAVPSPSKVTAKGQSKK